MEWIATPRFVGSVLLTLLAMDTPCAQAVATQDERSNAVYPVRPVRVILGYAPGGTVDLIGRGMAEELRERLKQTVIIENRPGAGGSIASEFAAKATPDGYTLYLGGLDSIVYSFLANGRKPLDPITDFTPIAEVARNEFLVVIHNALPVNSVGELISLAKARPGTIFFASSGNGSTSHILGERFAVTAKIEMLHVPYKQALITDLLAGRVHLVFAPAPSIAAYINTGNLKVLATLAPQRSPNAPDRPTLLEAGFPGFWHIGLLHLYAPAATPHRIVLQLNRHVRSAVQAPAFIGRLAGVGDAPGRPMSSDEAAAVLRERRAWMDQAFAIAMAATKPQNGTK